MSAITIIDYGMGNLRSVQKAIERVGSSATITSCPEEIATAEKLILPGVGAFRDAIQALHEHQLVDVIHESIDAGKPFLGICLGLQLLFELSREDGEYGGLSVVPGSVERFEDMGDLKVPHMGWNQLCDVSSDNPLFAGIDPSAWFYFVHSYYVVPRDDSWVAARTEYGPRFVSAIHRDNVFATQFHPEKSQKTGLQLLTNYIRL